MTTTVLHVTASLEPHAGSVAISLSHLFPLLKQRGFESHVITCDAKPFECEAATVHGFEPELLPKLIHDADLIHLHGLATGIADTVVERAQRPVIFSPMGELSGDSDAADGWFGRFRRRARLRKFLHRATVTALNDMERRAVGATEKLTYGLDVARLGSLAPNDGDLPDIGNQKCLLFLGAIDPKEGLVALLRALAELGTVFDRWHVFLAGPDTDGWGMQLQAAVNRKGAADRITLVRDPDLRTQVGLLRRADLLVAPSLRVRCPVAVNMAVALDVPVLASPAVALDGVAGHVHVCNPNPTDLRRAFAQLFANGNAQPRRTGTTGAEWIDHLDGWLDLYARCNPDEQQPMRQHRE